jgi:hypothetical protein
MIRSMPSPVSWLLTAVLVGCATNLPANEWKKFKIDLSGKSISISAPDGSFRGTNLSYVDLTHNKKKLVVLFERSWIASGMLADKGALETKLLLNRFENRKPQQDFLGAVALDYQQDIGKVFPEVELVNITQRKIGGKEWTCFFVTKMQLPDCVLELSSDYFLVWRRSWIANTDSRPTSSMDQVADNIEQSIELDF